MAQDIPGALTLTDRDLIKNIVDNYFIIDYGIVSKVNPDKTINVIHAKIPVVINGPALKQMETKNLEVLTTAGGGFSFVFDIKKGDRVLLLGFKNYIESVDDVTAASEVNSALHYTRETMKAFPLCAFNGDAKVTIEAKDGTMKVDTEQKLELNGNSKQFVTWSELNQALQQVITQIKTHTHAVSGAAAGPSPDLTALLLDISAAKTTSVVTGG